MTITTIRPISTLLAGGWRDGGGLTTLDPDVSDDNNATYIVGTIAYASSGYYCQMHLGNISALDSDERVMRVRVRTKHAKSAAAGPNQRAAVSVFDTVTINRHDMKPISALSTTVKEVAQAWWTNGPNTKIGGVFWGETPGETTTLINRLGVVCNAHNDYGGGGAFLRIHEIYVDVDIHTRVTVSGVTVTGPTTTATPTVSWTYNTNADFDPQRSYQVKIFTQAQVNAPGFSADAVAGVWDSGVQRSTASLRVVGTPLINGVTYVAYVRVASDFNNTNWWTEFAASSSFTMNLTSPPTPTLTVTAEGQLPGPRAHLVVDTKLNLLGADDASFELGVGSWGVESNTSMTQSGTQFLHGTQSMRITGIASGTISAITAGGVFPYQIFPDHQYTALASFRAGTTGRSCRVEIEWVDRTGALLSTSTGSNITDSTSGWTQAFVTATAPAGSYGARVRVKVLSVGAGEHHYVDQVSLHTGAGTSWFPGGWQKSSSFGDRFDHVVIEYLDWHQPPNETINILNTNMATGGETYNDPSHGFYVRHDEDQMTTEHHSMQHAGEACVRWIVGETTGSILDLGTPQGLFSATATPTATMPGVPGRTYTLSFYVMSHEGEHNLALAAVGIDSTGATVGSATVGSTVEVGMDWTRIHVTYTVAAGAAAVRGELRNLDSALTEFLIDSGQLQEGSELTEWQRPTQLIPDWQPVRGAIDALNSDVQDGIAHIYDREVSPGVIRLYRAWTRIELEDGNVLRSADALWTPVRLDVPGQSVWLLSDPFDPLWNQQVCLSEFTESVEEDAHESHPVRPLNRYPYGQRPVVISDWISGNNGQMTITVESQDEWFALKAMLHTPRTLLLRFPDGGQRYLHFQSRRWPRDAAFHADIHRVVVDFVEVARPFVTA